MTSADDSGRSLARNEYDTAMPEADDLPAQSELDVIATSGRYVLAGTDEYFGVWDLDADAQEPLERFPLTDDGFAAADRRFRDLKGNLLREKYSAARVLWWTLWIGVGIWLGAGVFAALLSASAFESPGERWFDWAQVADTAGFRLAVGSLIGLVATAMRSTVRLSRPEASEDSALRPWLYGMLIVGFVIWVPAAISDVLVYRNPSIEGPGAVAIAFLVVSTLAFRLWLAAAVLIGADWVLRGRASSAPDALMPDEADEADEPGESDPPGASTPI